MRNVLTIDYPPARVGNAQIRRLEWHVYRVATPGMHVEAALSLMLFNMNDELGYFELEVGRWSNPRDFTLALEALGRFEDDPDILTVFELPR